MSTNKKELTGLDVSRLMQPGVYAVGGVHGLYLQIMGNSKVWVLRATMGGKRRRMGLGAYPTVTLSKARERAREAYDLINQGIDPIDERRRLKRSLELEKANAITFAKACAMYIKTKEHEWTNEKHRQQWARTLEVYAFPTAGNIPIGEVDQDHLLKILQPIWLVKTDTANRVRGRIETVLDWAAVRKLREGDNPARWRGHLEILLPAPSKISKVRHHPALHYKDVPNAYKRIAKVQGQSGKALQFLILTAARTSEILGAQWAEIDLDNKVWTIPEERMKAGRVHRVPLSDQTVKLIRSLITKQENSIYLFENDKGRMLSNMAMLTTMRRLKFENKEGDKAVPHGFRSSFRDWCAECAHAPRDLAEMALAHSIENKTEAAYRRGDMLERRAELMQRWADYLDLFN